MEKHEYCQRILTKDTGFEKLSYCDKNNFANDISKLCEHCPIKSEIQQGLIDQIEFQINIEKELCTKDDFKKYLDRQASSASEGMERAQVGIIRDHGKNLAYEVMESRVKTYIWNIERRKILKKYKEGVEGKTEAALNKIWSPKPKLNIQDFLQKGIDASIWDENYRITTKRGSLYSTGKKLLANTAIVLQGHSIKKETDYQLIGEAFCVAFNIDIKESSKQPFKAFSSSGDLSIMNELKRVFVTSR